MNYDAPRVNCQWTAALNAGEHLLAGLREWERTASPTLKIPLRTSGGTPIPTLGRPDWRSTLTLPSLSLAGSSASSVTSMLRAKSGLGTGEPVSLEYWPLVAANTLWLLYLVGSSGFTELGVRCNVANRPSKGLGESYLWLRV